MPLVKPAKYSREEYVNFDSAFQFDGVDDKIRISMNNGYEFDQQKFAFSLFIKPERFDALGNDLYPSNIGADFSQVLLIGDRSTGVGDITRLSLYRKLRDPDRIMLYIGFSNATTGTVNRIFNAHNKEIEFGKWTHVFGHFVTTSTYRYHINGTPFNGGSVGGTLGRVTSSNVVISEDYSDLYANSNHYAGQLRDLALFEIPDSTIITDAIVQKFERGSLVPEELHPYCFAHFPLDKIELQ